MVVITFPINDNLDLTLLGDYYTNGVMDLELKTCITTDINSEGI